MSKRTTKRAGATIRKSRKVGGAPDYERVVRELREWLGKQTTGPYEENMPSAFVSVADVRKQLTRLTAAQRQKGGE
jgi:DNA transposition AAA+ family ATPase